MLPTEHPVRSLSTCFLRQCIQDRHFLPGWSLPYLLKVAANSIEPMTDGHASAAYRRQLTATLTERAVRRAAADGIKNLRKTYVSGATS